VAVRTHGKPFRKRQKRRHAKPQQQRPKWRGRFAQCIRLRGQSNQTSVQRYEPQQAGWREFSKHFHKVIRVEIRHNDEECCARQHTNGIESYGFGIEHSGRGIELFEVEVFREITDGSGRYNYHLTAKMKK